MRSIHCGSALSQYRHLSASAQVPGCAYGMAEGCDGEAVDGRGTLGTNGQPSPPTDRDAILLVAVKALVGIHECIVEWIVSHLVNALHANTLAAPLLLGDMADRGLGAFALEV